MRHASGTRRRAAAARPLPGRPAGPERGSATVLLAGICAAALVLTLAVLALVQVQAARHTAQGAGDLGALAAAAALQRGAGTAESCAVAHRVVAANGARGVDCRVDGSEVVVAAAVTVDLGVLGQHDAAARARAGPSRGAAP